MGKGSEISLTSLLFLNLLGTLVKRMGSEISLLVTSCVSVGRLLDFSGPRVFPL